MSTPVDTLAVRPPKAGDLATETLALAARRLRHLRRTPGRLVGVIMNPLVLMVAVGYLFENAITAPGSGRYLDYLMAGVVLQVGLASIGPTAVSVSLDLRTGLIDRFRSLPIARLGVLVGHAVSDTVAGVVGLAVVTLVGLGLGWRSHGGVADTVAGFLVVVVFIHAMVWVGILLGLLVRSPESIDSIGALVLVLFSFLSNAVFPTTAMPDWIRPLVDWNPTSAVATLCRRLWGSPGQDAAGFAGAHAGTVFVVTIGALLVATTALSLRKFRSSAF